jgi:hypothetical protein
MESRGSNLKKNINKEGIRSGIENESLHCQGPLLRGFKSQMLYFIE